MVWALMLAEAIKIWKLALILHVQLHFSKVVSLFFKQNLPFSLNTT
jgi:hypothetical protein